MRRQLTSTIDSEVPLRGSLSAEDTEDPPFMRRYCNIHQDLPLFPQILACQAIQPDLVRFSGNFTPVSESDCKSRKRGWLDRFASENHPL